MNFRLFAVAAAFALPMSPATGEENVSKLKSSDARTAAELDQHGTDVRSLDRKFQEDLARLEEAYLSERERMQQTLVESLAKEQKALTKKGKLDQAIQVREQIEQIEATEIVPPHPATSQSTATNASVSTRTKGIQGTWRWSNGVDIRNLENGRTNGNGSWRLINPREQVYEFQWKRLSPDHVKLSPNGRVLEGTKANNPTVRVWAVRVD
ncbi:hypothetical protein [Rhodopirellula europaea]|uniref:hypothetical protein n=1 Tax=Rhodopirellula europaea TaxID=1263866 RepID=UPI003D2C8EE3|tara:strand:- start:1516 stop:2145 length:630 start_codon:yes stop_codon:yes gene_type:complete